ncbi:MAG: DUF3168 domain-containing protein [Pseudomonadota bacterium]
MSYGVSAALQAAIFQALTADAALAALVGTAIYDAVPSGNLPPLYVTLGPETARAAHDKTGRGALHHVSVDVVTTAPGFAQAKQTAGAVCDALDQADLPLSRGRLVYLNFNRATASRSDQAAGRTITLRFAARTEDI